jgi:hypothetical protein
LKDRTVLIELNVICLIEMAGDRHTIENY